MWIIYTEAPRFDDDGLLELVNFMYFQIMNAAPALLTPILLQNPSTSSPPLLSNSPIISPKTHPDTGLTTHKAQLLLWNQGSEYISR
jgi:hypothetical protein